MHEHPALNLCRVTGRRPILARVLVVAFALAGVVPQAAGGDPDGVHAGPYAYRGVIFGPYGRPWSHTDRLSVIRWMGRPWRDTGRARMNLYIHAAKDDVYQRLRWRAPYPAPTMREFTDEIAVAHSLGVEWVPNLSPGVPLIPSAAVPDGPPSRDICFSCPRDLDALVAKLRPFALARVRTFMISFDDVQKISTHIQDLLAYGIGDAAYGRMNADLLNRLKRRLRAEFPPGPGERQVTILTVPAEYSGTAQTAYLKTFGERLDADIRVMWTGTHVVSPEILASEAAAFSAAISTPASGKRKLVVWDNFPVNDYNGNIFSSTGLPTNFKLNMGPYKGRRADLTRVIDGIVSNPMNEAEASKIPLYTVAAYLNDPAAYAKTRSACALDDDVAGCLSEAAWLEGIAEFGGPAAAAVFNFVSQMRSTPMDRTESPMFRARWEALRDAFGSPFWPGPWSALASELTAEGSAPAALRAGLGNERFLTETANHLTQLGRNVEVGMLAAELLASIRPSLEAEIVSISGGVATVRGRAGPSDPAAAAATLAALVRLEVAMRASPYSVHGDRFQHSIDQVYIRENQMDAFTGFAHEALLAWLPLSPVAATGPVVVRAGGRTAAPGGDGRFDVTVPITPGQTEVVVIATDAAGFRTGMRLALD